MTHSNTKLSKGFAIWSGKVTCNYYYKKTVDELCYKHALIYTVINANKS